MLNIPMSSTLLVAALLAFAPAAIAQTPAAAPAQQGVSNEDLDLLRRNLQSERKQIVAETLKLTDAEATRFWPVFDAYVADSAPINDSKQMLIKEYTDKFGAYDDKAASAFIRRWLDVDTQRATLRASYIPKVEKVLPGIAAATFFQIDRRLAMLIELQLSSQLPLLQQQAEMTRK